MRTASTGVDERRSRTSLGDSLCVECIEVSVDWYGVTLPSFLSSKSESIGPLEV